RPRRGRGDRDRRGGVDGDGDRRPARLVGVVGGGGGDRVDAGRERAHRDRGAGADHPVAARGPGDPRGEGAVLDVGGGAREGDGGRRGGVDGEGDRRAARLAAAVGGRGRDHVRAAGERAPRDRAARAETPVTARAPGDVGGEGAVLDVGRGAAERDRRAQLVGGVVGGRRDGDGRRRVDGDGDRGAAGLAPAVGGGGGEHVRARRERARGDRAARAESAVA